MPLQAAMQGDDVDSSDHDPECIGIKTLAPVKNGATCRVHYEDPDETFTFRFSAQNLTDYFRYAVGCPYAKKCNCKAPQDDKDFTSVYYPRKYINTEGLFPSKAKYCEFPIITVFGKPDKPWCGNKMWSGYLRLVYGYLDHPRAAFVEGLMYHSRDDRECPSGKAGCLKKCDFF